LPHVYQAVATAGLEERPFPHLVSSAALPAELVVTLRQEMPPPAVLTQADPAGYGPRFALPSPLALQDGRPSRRWKEALRACLEDLPRLLEIFVARFERQILEAYPDFAARFAPLPELRAVPRYQAGRRRHEVGMDVQVVTNLAAVVDGAAVRGPHLDLPDKLFSGLVYLRAPEDDSEGGDLDLYVPADPGGVLSFDAGNHVDAGAVRLARTYPRRDNLLVLPLNTPRALHGVSLRRRTAHLRYHLHLVAELVAPLFAVPGRTPPSGAPAADSLQAR
jgi:hypothetical protein